jgi:hypothetical protein
MAYEDDLYTEFDPEAFRTESGDADAASAFEAFSSDSLIFGDLVDKWVTTGAEKAAAERAKGAQAAAQSEFGLKKARAAKNDAIVAGLEKDIMGLSEDEIYNMLLEQAGYARADGKPPASAPAQNVAPPTSHIEMRFDDYTGTQIPVEVAGPPPGWKPPEQAAAAPSGTYQPDGGTVSGETPSGRKFKFDKPDEDQLRAAARKIFENQQEETLPGQLGIAFGERQAASDRLIQALDDIERVELDTSDWEAEPNAAKRKEETLKQQQQSQDKLWGLTDVQETAQERLMREMARRSMETDLRAQREAQAQSLKERGVYGSGAELAGFLGAQQELAQRRSLEEMAASKNAQERALQALGKFGERAVSLGNQDIAEGTQENLHNQFNAEQRKDADKSKAENERAENEAEAKREATIHDSSTNVAAARENKAKDITNTKMALANQKIGVGTQGTTLQTSGLSNIANNFKGESQKFKDKDAQDTDEMSWSIL